MISLIVPIYNAETYLNACVESLLHQTQSDIEVLLIDDSSTDGSWAIAQTFAEQDHRVTAIRQTHAGQSVARNRGLEAAHGDYIAFVDADDALEPDWCARHLAAIDGVDYVQSGYKRILTNHQSPIINHQSPITNHQFTSPCMRLYRRQAIAHLRFAEGYIYEDVLYSVDLWLSHATCRVMDYTGYLYTLNPQSTTSQPHPEARRRLMRTLRDKMRNTDCRGKYIILLTLARLQLHFMKITKHQ